MSFIKLYPISKDSIALIAVAFTAFGIFIAGLTDVLNYIIVKAILILSFISILVTAIIFGIKNMEKENRLEDTPQDDSL